MKTHLRNFLAKIGLLRFIRQSWLWRLKGRQLYTVFQKNAMATFWEVNRICKSNEIKIWPTLGTLLGIEREGGPLKHDLDLDFGVFLDVKIQEKIRKEFLAKGFKLIGAAGGAFVIATVSGSRGATTIGFASGWFGIIPAP